MVDVDNALAAVAVVTAVTVVASTSLCADPALLYFCLYFLWLIIMRRAYMDKQKQTRETDTSCLKGTTALTDKPAKHTWQGIHAITNQ